MLGMSVHSQLPDDGVYCRQVRETREIERREQLLAFVCLGGTDTVGKGWDWDGSLGSHFGPYGRAVAAVPEFGAEGSDKER